MAKEKQKKGTFLHGIGASEHLDSSGERISVEGIDISSLTVDGTLNWEHNSKDASAIVGKITEAKKILKRSDCENDNHRYFWDKVKMPYLYIAGELFDAVDHQAAKDVAAMLRYDNQNDNKNTKKLINFSIEGSRLDKKGSNILKCIARKISITITPCNKVCGAEELKSDTKKNNAANSGFDQHQENFSFIQDIVSKGEHESSCQIMKTTNSGEMGFVNTNMKSEKTSKDEEMKKKVKKGEAGANPRVAFVKPGKKVKPKDVGDVGHAGFSLPKEKIIPASPKKRLGKYDSNVRKALAAGSMMGSPSTAVQGSAIQKEANAFSNSAMVNLSKPGSFKKNKKRKIAMNKNESDDLKKGYLPSKVSPSPVRHDKVMGRTSSGKTVLANHKHAANNEHADFSHKDHADAASMHNSAARYYSSKGVKSKNEKIQNNMRQKMDFHANQSKLHSGLSKEKQGLGGKISSAFGIGAHAPKVSGTKPGVYNARNKLERSEFTSLANQAFESLEKKEELISFLSNRLPKVSETEIKALAKAVAYAREKRLEKSLEALLKGDVIDFQSKKKISEDSPKKNKIVPPSKKKSQIPLKDTHKYTMSKEAHGHYKAMHAKARDEALASGKDHTHHREAYHYHANMSNMIGADPKKASKIKDWLDSPKKKNSNPRTEMKIVKKSLEALLKGDVIDLQSKKKISEDTRHPLAQETSAMKGRREKPSTGKLRVAYDKETHEEAQRKAQGEAREKAIKEKLYDPNNPKLPYLRQMYHHNQMMHTANADIDQYKDSSPWSGEYSEHIKKKFGGNTWPETSHNLSKWHENQSNKIKNIFHKKFGEHVSNPYESLMDTIGVSDESHPITGDHVAMFMDDHSMMHPGRHLGEKLEKPLMVKKPVNE